MSSFVERDISSHAGFVGEEENVAALWKSIDAMHAQNRMSQERWVVALRRFVMTSVDLCLFEVIILPKIYAQLFYTRFLPCNVTSSAKYMPRTQITNPSPHASPSPLLFPPLHRKEPEYTFYDGPPFATGLPHYGHILAGTIKDTVTRYAAMNGFRVERRAGWDCHGLPVEYEVS